MAKRLGKLIFGAWLVRVPLKVVRLVNDQQVPRGLHCLFRSLGRLGHPVDVGNQELIVFKRIETGLAGFNGAAAFLIKNTKQEIKTAKELDEPLVHKRVWEQDQHSFNPTAHKHSGKNQARLDGFSQTDLVCKQDPG